MFPSSIQSGEHRTLWVNIGPGEHRDDPVPGHNVFLNLTKLQGSDRRTIAAAVLQSSVAHGCRVVG